MKFYLLLKVRDVVLVQCMENIAMVVVLLVNQLFHLSFQSFEK